MAYGSLVDVVCTDIVTHVFYFILSDPSHLISLILLPFEQCRVQASRALSLKTQFQNSCSTMEQLYG